MIKEEWRNIKGYENIYQVSNYGNVRSLNYNNTGKVKLLSKCLCRGYHIVHFNKNGVSKSPMVHRLVAEAFIPNPCNLPKVNHKNEIKTDNKVENLEWCTVAYNNTFGSRMKRVKEKLSKRVACYKNGKLVKIYPSTQSVTKDGFSQGCVSGCCRGIYKQYKGLIWRFID